MPKPANTRYRTTNWSDYNASLKRRGSFSVWFDPDIAWEAERNGKRGHPETFSECAIQTCLTLNFLIDITGIRFRGDGEWLARKHGATRRREWRKVHLAMDIATGDIRGVEFTSGRQGDSPILPELLAQIPAGEEIATVTADGVYDTRRCHAAILEHGAEPILPIRRNGPAWKPDCPAAISRTRFCG